MRDQYFVSKIRPLKGYPIFLLFLLMVLSGCQAKEPPLTPAAAAFKKEVQECLDRLCQGVVTSIVKGDVASINETLKHLEPEALKLCRMCPFRIGILNKTGETLTVFPYKEEALGNFSSYEAVAQTLKDRRINQQRLFLQNGAQIYVICVPLLKDENLVGIMVLSLSVEEAKKRWGLTEQDFQGIDFNIKRP